MYMKYSLYFYLLIMIIGHFCSCVSYKASFNEDWNRQATIDNPYFTMYLIGDAGNAELNQSTEVFDHLKLQLDTESSSSAIVWLGDNIYPVGLASPTSPYYPAGRHKLMAQLETMTDYNGYKFFVPGNHDWYTYGRIGLRRQELMVDSFLQLTPNPNNQVNYFMPDKGCGDPQVITLKDGIAILMMDSHWFLNEESRAGDQSVCDVSTPEAFIAKLKSEVELHAEESLIVASHHPPYTYAHHGGKFPLKDDLFPLTQALDWLYLPLPIAGFTFNRMRLRLSEQDVYHPLYRSYTRTLSETLQAKGRNIIASGHEHTLQMIEQNEQYYIVSGAGTKNNKVGTGKGSQFAIGAKGYVKIVFKDSKNAVAQFIVPGQEEDNNNVVYEKLIRLD